MLLYDESTPPCKFFFETLARERPDRVNGFLGWRKGLPWIKYEDSIINVLNDHSIQLAVSFNEASDKVDRLNIILSVYAFNGTWLGYKQLTNELFLCSSSKFEISRFMDIGTNLHKTCYFNIAQLLNKEEPLFYDICKFVTLMLTNRPR